MAAAAADSQLPHKKKVENADWLKTVRLCLCPCLCPCRCLGLCVLCWTTAKKSRRPTIDGPRLTVSWEASIRSARHCITLTLTSSPPAIKNTARKRKNKHPRHVTQKPPLTSTQSAVSHCARGGWHNASNHRGGPSQRGRDIWQGGKRGRTFASLCHPQCPQHPPR